MRYFLYVQLQGFYMRQQAGGRFAPLAILRDGVVLDVNFAAAKLGVRSGMEQRTARAIAPEIEFIQWEAGLHGEAQKGWLDVCVDYSGVIEPEDQHSAFIDLSGHPNPYDVSEQLIRRLVAATGLNVQFGAAETKWVAKLAARSNDGGTALKDPAAFLSPLPVSLLEPIVVEHRHRLQFLGYSTIGQISGIPAEILRQQFGPEGLRIAKAARGEILEAIKAEYPPHSLTESLIFEGEVESTEVLDHAVKDLANRVSHRLREKGLHGQDLCLQIELEGEKVLSCRRRFSKPIYSYATALSALRLLLQEGRTEQPVAAIRLRMSDLAPNREKQKALYVMAKADDGSALEQVRTVFGSQSVQLGREIAVPRRVLVLREWKNATGWS